MSGNFNKRKQITSFEDTIGPRQRAFLENKWRSKLGAVASVDDRYKLEGRQKTNGERLRLALALENVDREINRAYRMFEGTQVPDVGPFKFHVFDMITALYPTSIADEIVSLQVLPQKLGQIFFLRYVYGSDKGGVAAGSDMLSPFTGASGYNNYSSEEVDDEFFSAVDASAKYDGFLQWIPVRRGTLTISTGGEPISDNGKGDLKQGGNTVGSVDYNTGEVTIDLTGGTNATEDLAANYIYDQEYAPTRTGQVNVRVDEAIITARPHKLSALWAFDAAYDLQASQGVNIEEAILEACTAELRHERDGIVMRSLYNQAANSSTFSKTVPTALTQREHYEAFITELSKASTRITQETKRATGNWVVVGKDGIDILNAVGAPRFEGTGEIAPAGPHYAGTLDKRMKVYFNPFFEEDEYLVGYKGSLFLDSGYVIGDYLPIFASQLIMLEDFMGRRGFASMYGTKMINNRMYVRGQITG